MGRIKPRMVKNASKALLRDKEHEFTGEFERNKLLLKGSMPSKKIRNKMAGYLARLVKVQEAEKL